MNKKKAFLTGAGFLAAIVGFGLSLITDSIEHKQMELMIEEKLDERLKEETPEDEEEG